MTKFFDPEVWRVKVEKRFSARCKKGRPSTLNYFRELASIQKIEKVVAWAEQRGIAVQFGDEPNGIYRHDDKIIGINKRLSTEKQLFILLHECGHALIGPRTRRQRFGRGYSASTEPWARSTLLYKIDVIDEELEAWARGAALANRLGIIIDIEQWNKIRAQCINSYLHWATGKNRQQKNSGPMKENDSEQMVVDKV